MFSDGQISPCKHHVTVKPRYIGRLHIAEFFKIPMTWVIVPHGFSHWKSGAARSRLLDVHWWSVFSLFGSFPEGDDLIKANSMSARSHCFRLILMKLGTYERCTTVTFPHGQGQGHRGLKLVKYGLTSDRLVPTRSTDDSLGPSPGRKKYGISDFVSGAPTLDNELRLFGWICKMSIFSDKQCWWNLVRG